MDAAIFAIAMISAPAGRQALNTSDMALSVLPPKMRRGFGLALPRTAAIYRL